MGLQQILEGLLARFSADNPLAPADSHRFGFASAEGEYWTLTFDKETARAEPGIREAETLLFAPESVFAGLFSPVVTDRESAADQVVMRPDYPFNGFLLSILLNTFHLRTPRLETRQRPYIGTLPFPPRYPVVENRFRFAPYTPTPIPTYDPDALPALIADDYPLWVAMYDWAWALAFRHLRQPDPGTGFVANYIDIPFNGNMFMWDSCFMMLFGGYARRQFRFMGTLDNFYAKQHDDGFICRELVCRTGADVFQSLDPRSTGPNILAWTEWLDYQISHDRERLARVFPVLVGYHRWWRDWRTHPDGSYWTCGWGSGMDNQTRVPRSEYHHRHYTWADATFQQALNCRVLIEIGREVGRTEFAAELGSEYAHLAAYANAHLWDEATAFYYDRAPDGTLSQTRSIGAYWALLAGIVPDERRGRFVAHLQDPGSFNRPHRIPAQSRDSKVYDPLGGYWLGGVWPPTNYMVLRGLTTNGYPDLAHEIALNHLQNVAAVFGQTGTLWENYAPEEVRQGKPSSPDFVGWTGLSAISVPLEYGIGLRPLPTSNGTDALLWDIRLSGRHGVLRYPLPSGGEADLVYEGGTIRVAVRGGADLCLTVLRGDTAQTVTFPPGEHTLTA